jgi:hypothetical protein
VGSPGSGRSRPPEGHFVQMDLYAIGCLLVFAASAGARP